jgi:hypothetical protein
MVNVLQIPSQLLLSPAPFFSSDSKRRAIYCYQTQLLATMKLLAQMQLLALWDLSWQLLGQCAALARTLVGWYLQIHVGFSAKPVPAVTTLVQIKA